MNVIQVSDLVKHFRSPLAFKGPWYQKINRYLFPKYQSHIAVDGLSFSVKAGERVAFIGPNGAGKSTTIKMLTGIMLPTQGQIQVLGKTPWKQRRALAYKIGAVFGQRSQLWFHLPVQETLQLLATIYDIPRKIYQDRLKKLSKQFEIEHLLNRPVRQLSLGERMRAELVASLLHQPAVLFLDEPTIGLDITAKAIIRDLIRSQSEQEGVTVLLTSHDTDDIEKVCDRVIIIDRGKLLLDDTLKNLQSRYIQKKIMSVITEEENNSWMYEGTQIIEHAPHQLKLEIDLTKHSVEAVIADLLAKTKVKDLTIENPPLETIIQLLYRQAHAQ